MKIKFAFIDFHFLWKIRIIFILYYLTYFYCHITKAIALSNIGRLEEALAEAEKAYTLQPQYAEAYNTKGNVLAQLLRLEDALFFYDMAAKVNATYASAYWNKAAILTAFDKPDEARELFSKAISLNPLLADIPRDLSTVGLR